KRQHRIFPLSFDKPGAKKYFLSQGGMFLSTVMKDLGCVVVLRPDNEDEEEEDLYEDIDEEYGLGTTSYCRVPTASGLVVSVSKGDICSLHVDAVVNAANEELKHIGGVAFALLKAAGPQLQKLSDDYISKKGHLKPGDAIITDSCNLPCKYVFHAVCPFWDNGTGQAKEREHDCFSRSGVSKAILDAAGSNVQQEVSRIVNAPGYQQRAMILTTAGLLPSGAIIHVVGHKDPVKIKEVVYSVLKLSEQNTFSSVSFPALGTGLCQWEDMKGVPLKRCTLTPTSQEYKDVEQELKRTGLTPNIISIERIQNKTLWQSYQLFKKNMEEKNKHKNNEKQLFHGTGSNSIDLINNQGFNRSYAGTHAAMYGNGSYFALTASYSHGYAQLDAQGHRRMYLARVLVGEFTQGKRGLITPPAKGSGNAADLYDSVTDNAANPSMFIVFNDIQAYPEYLITYT
uniref:Poly [ADP-ribose] polymerase n=1 Tax=Myripristis murdjan TaxID=586833 RepID=A0A667WJI6_9TELE